MMRARESRNEAKVRRTIIDLRETFECDRKVLLSMRIRPDPNK